MLLIRSWPSVEKIYLRHPLRPRFYPHSMWASMGPVQAGVRFQARVHSQRKDPGCWGCYLAGDLRWISALRAVTRTRQWMWLRQLSGSISVIHVFVFCSHVRELA